MKPLPGWLMAPLLVLFTAASVPASSSASIGARPTSEPLECLPRALSDMDSLAQAAVAGKAIAEHPRLHLVAHTGALRILPPYPSSIDPFNTPWDHHADRFGLAGAYDLFYSSAWRFGAQVEGIYTRHALPFYVPDINRWRRRIVLYGTYTGDGWTVTIAVVVHDTGPQERLARVLAGNRHGTRRDYPGALANGNAGRATAAGIAAPARDMRKIRPQDDVLKVRKRWRASVSSELSRERCSRQANRQLNALSSGSVR